MEDAGQDYRQGDSGQAAGESHEEGEVGEVDGYYEGQEDENASEDQGQGLVVFQVVADWFDYLVGWVGNLKICLSFFYTLIINLTNTF